MKSPLTLGSLLLLTSALVAPAALAQTTTPPLAPSNDASAPAATPDDEEKVEISGPGADAGGDIVVTGRYTPEPIRATSEVVSVLSTAEIARAGDGDIAGALQRVTGLSVVGNGFVYVRGLGDRYSAALLNGSPLPSPEPLRRVVPLDIFPTSVLASAVVQKSYSVNYPGEFGGGVINLTTKAIPTEPFLNMSVGISGDSETTGDLGYTCYGSKLDWSGFDSGARDVPGPLAQAFKSGKLITEGPNFTRAQMQDITASLLNSATTVVQKNGNIPANFSADLSAGQTWDIADGRVGMLLTAAYSNSWRTRQALQETSTDPGLGGIPQRSFTNVITDNRILVNGMFAVGAEFGEHKIRWTNLFIRDTLKQARIASGFDRSVEDQDANLPPSVLKQATYWFERQLIDTQLVGEFKFSDLSVDLRGTYANSQRESPYERDISYVYSPVAGDYVNNLRSGGQSATISFSDLNEDVYAGAIDLAYKLPTANEITISTGYAYNDTKRTSVRRDFQYRPAGDVPFPVAQLRPDGLLSDYNVYTYNILLTETSGQSGAAAFEAGLRVHAGYGQIEAEIIPSLKIQAGVRYEDATQTVTPLDITGTGAVITPTRLANSYWLPAATLTWNLAEDMQLRVAASKTIARPQFRELALQLYQDNESDRQFFGNPFLQDSKLKNAEIRYEWYFDRGQRFTAAAFYKSIDKPIEAFGFLAGGATLQTSFANAPKADLYGAEVEVQKYVPLDRIGGDDGFFSTRRLVLVGNYTYSKSKLKVGAGDTVTDPFGNVSLASTLFTNGDPLTGQSKHLANIQIGLEDTERLSQQTFLFTYASNRVTNRGPIQGVAQQPDIIERPGIRLDFVAREGVEFIGTEMEIKFEARNLTRQKYSEFQQAGTNRIAINRYDLGTSFSLGVELKF